MELMTRRKFFTASAATLATVSGLTRFGFTAPTAKNLDRLTDKAFTALKVFQNNDGSFAPSLHGTGVTALAVAALLRSGWKLDQPVVAKALAYLEKNVQKDGGIYTQRFANYSTCVSLMAFAEANANKKYDKVIEGAVKFLKGFQQNDDTSEKDSNYGGVGYDGRTRPDLLNTHFYIDALLTVGVSKDDPAVKRALVYVGRCQNLKSEFNPLPFAEKTDEKDKGGFVSATNESGGDTGKDDKGGQNVTPAGGLRSYGSTSFAGLKCLLDVGVGKDDTRVKGAFDWTRRHYTLSENPSQKDAGLFHYYYLFAKTMNAIGEDMFIDAKEMKHDWRQDLFDELKRRQKVDGVWANANNTLSENSPELAIALGLLALSYCKPKTK